MYITKSGSKIYFDIKAERKDNYILLKSEKILLAFLQFFSEWILNDNGRKYPTMTSIQSKCCPKGVSFNNGLSLSCDISRADKADIDRKCLE